MAAAPWLQYAKPETQGGGPWEQYGSKPEAPTPPDNRNAIQMSFDKNTETSPDEPLLETGLKSVVGAIGSPFVHPIETAKAVAKMAPALSGNYTAPAFDLAEGMAKPAANDYKEGGLPYAATKMAGNLFGNVALGEAAGAVPGFIGDVAEALPSRAKGGKILDSVMAKAKDQPVTLSPETMAPLERTQQLAMAGGKPFGAADKLYQRSQTVNPITYGEARDFASNMSLSPEEKMGLKKSMKYEVPRLSKSFNKDIGRAADAAGVGPEYQRGMSAYRNGARFEDARDALAKYGGRMALGALGAGGLYELKKALF